MDYRTILDIVAITGVIIYGIFAVINFFDKGRKDKEAEADKADERVIFLLKEQVAALEKKVAEQAREMKDLTLKLEALIAENKTLREVLQGRDQATLAYQQKGLETMALFPSVKQKVDDIYAIISQGVKTEVKTTISK